MSLMVEARPTLLATGVPNLDRVLGGGLQEHNSYLIVGGSGTGKSVLAEQIAFYRARQDDQVLFITGLDEPHRNLLEHMATLKFVDFRLLGPKVETVSVVPFLERSVADKLDVLRKTVLNSHPRLVIMDGLGSYEAFLDGVSSTYQWLYGLVSWLALEGVTLVLTKDVDLDNPATGPEFSLVDGVLALQRYWVDGCSQRLLSVWKIRGQEPLEGWHSFTLDENGVTVWPRPASLLTTEEKPQRQGRAAFGVPTLDPMLGGGLPEGSSTLIVGEPGTGRTAFALSFLGDGARSGQAGLWLGFRQSRGRLLAMAQQWDHGLAEAEANRRMEMIVRPPLGLDVGELAALLTERVAALKAQRLVVDGLDELSAGLADPNAASEFMTWLTGFLAQQGVTGVLTARWKGPQTLGFSLADVPLAAQVDSLIALWHVYVQQSLRRALAILKLGSAEYDTTVREFTVDRYGVSVGEPLQMESAREMPMAAPQPARGPL
jgi:circadian clock protein KaiC